MADTPARMAPLVPFGGLHKTPRIQGEGQTKERVGGVARAAKSQNVARRSISTIITNYTGTKGLKIRALGNLSAILLYFWFSKKEIFFPKKELPGLATMFQDLRNAVQLREVGANMLWKDIGRTRCA